MAGVADRHDVERRGGDRVHDGGQDLALEVADLPVEAVQHLGRVVVVEGVGAQRAAQPAHGDGGPQAVPLDVAHHEPHVAVRQREDVVPVAAQVSLGGQVAHREVQTGDGRRRGRQQAALQGQRRPGARRPGSARRGVRRSPPPRTPGARVSSGVNVRGIRHPTCSTPSRPVEPKTGTPSSRRTPKSRRIGLRTDISVTSLTTTGSRLAATRPAKPDPTGTCVAPRHRRPSPADAAGSRTVAVSSSSSNVAVSEPMRARTFSIRPWTDTGFAVTGIDASSAVGEPQGRLLHFALILARPTGPGVRSLGGRLVDRPDRVC